MRYCLVTHSVLGKKPTLSCSTIDDTILIAIFVVILSFVIYLAKKVSEISVDSTKKDEPKQCKTNDKQEKKQEFVESDRGPISPRKSSCSVKSEDNSLTQNESILLTSLQVKSEEEPNVDDLEGIDQLDIKEGRASSGQFKNDVLVGYCLVNDFNRFGILDKTSSESHSSTEMTTDGVRGEISEEEKIGDDHSGASHVSQESVLIERPIQNKNSEHHFKHSNLTYIEKNVEGTKDVKKIKVSKEGKRLAVCESTLAMSDKKSNDSCSLSLICMSDSSHISERSRKLSIQKVKNWKVAPRPSLTIPKKATSLRPQKKINPIKNLAIKSGSTSQSPNNCKISNDKIRAKVESNRKVHSSLGIHAKPLNNSTDNKQVVKLRHQRKNLKIRKNCNEAPVRHERIQSFQSKVSRIGNQQKSSVENFVKHEPPQTSCEEKFVLNDVDKECMEEIINLTKNIKDCDKTLVHCEDSLKLHRSPSGDSSVKVSENLCTGSNAQPISLGTFMTTCDLRKRKPPVNVPDNLKNEAELLRSKILSKMGECDKLLLKCLSCKEETPIIVNDSLRTLKRKVSESISELQCGINEIEEKRKRESAPSSERDSFESFKTCVTFDDGKIDKNSSRKSHQEVQDLNKSKIVTNILNSLSKAEAYSNRLKEKAHTTRKREVNDRNNSSNHVTTTNFKKSLSMIDENGNSFGVKTNQSIKKFSVVHESKKKFKDNNFSRPPDFPTSPRKLSEQQCLQTIHESGSSEEECLSEADDDKKRCRRTTLCKGECRCKSNNIK
ncbi:hypothetical protein LSTR_LSTR008304 [Laodelphax striatellus]|uniref:Uncharacterized protein n=1 Tax=Laodelphax striatellus TaxID=195883 RepID=A0A482XJT8_LAOST|nr:hypothetical protein LSTR_LSTR008304 [Laodelphax striatellus]